MGAGPSSNDENAGGGGGGGAPFCARAQPPDPPTHPPALVNKQGQNAAGAWRTPVQQGSG